MRVLKKLLLGLNEGEIAAELRISRHTVHAHIGYLYMVFGVRSRSRLMAKIFAEILEA
jgi:DNA-binding CsgD family transcriptional regulator